MFEKRSLKLDLFMLLLLAGGVFLGASLLTYNPVDPPSTLVYPPHTLVENTCGPIGAYVGHYFFQFLGFGAYYLLGSLVIVVFLMLLRREIDQPVLRAVGWAISLVAFCALVTMALPDRTPGPEIGAGGYLGAMGQALLESNFATIGAYILALSVLLAGLFLCTDYLLLKFATFTALVSGRSVLQLGHLGHTAPKRRESRPETDLEEEFDKDEEEEWEYEDEEEEEEAPILKVRTPNKPREMEEDSGEDASDTGDDQTDDSTSAACGLAPTPTPLKSKLAKALRIKKTKPDNKSEREEIINQLEAADQQPESGIDYDLPSLDLLLQSEDISYEDHEREVRRKAKVLEKTFRNFGFNVRVVEIETGPVIAQYEVELEAGLRLSRITGLSDDLAIALRVPSVRIVAPIPGKNTVGIEVPNATRQIVRLREVIEEANGRVKRMNIPIYLGKDVSGNPMVVDLTTLPHLLIAGRTGTGKSVCLNTIIVSMLMSRGPDEVRMLMIDPKMVELSGYCKLPHLMHPVVTDMRKAEAILAWGVDKMEERYQLLARAGVRHVSVFNQLSEEELRGRIKPTSEDEWQQIPKQLPFVVIVADEMADLMMTSGKEVEQHIIRLAQKSRAVGIHLILATQKPTVDVITGLIKSNLPARIAFQVASRTDSRVVLDEMGADKLLGNGDMLFLSPGTSTLTRGQGTFLSDDEISRVVDFVGTDSPQFAKELIELKTKEEEEAAKPGKLKNHDDLYESAVDIVVREQRGSVSLLQRCLGIGYGRAARLIDYMAEDGIVGQYNGSQAREVQLSGEEWEAMNGEGAEPAETAKSTSPVTAATTLATSAGPRRSNKIVPGTDEPSDLEKEVGSGQGTGASSDIRSDAAPWEEEETDENEVDSELEEDEEAELDESEEADEEEWEYEDEEESAEEEEADELEEDELEEDEEWEEEEEYSDSA